MNEEVRNEPVFRANKRRKVFRKRADSEEREVTSSAAPEAADIADADGRTDVEENGATGVIRFQKKAGVKKHGIGFSSSDAFRGREGESEERALVLANENGAQEAVQADRFVKPTGKVAVAENKHMTAYIDSKMAEMRSATSTPLNGTLSQRPTSADDPTNQANTDTNLAIKPNGGTSANQPTFDQAQSRSTRVYERPTKRRKPPQRDQTDVARDSIIDQIMQESQVPHYQRSGSHTPANDLDNDAATAEAFKAQLIAEMEEANRRRPPTTTISTKATNPNHGPKLGGSRSQRAKFTEERQNAAKK